MKIKNLALNAIDKRVAGVVTVERPVNCTFAERMARLPVHLHVIHT